MRTLSHTPLTLTSRALLLSPTGVLHEEPSLCLVKVKLLKVEGLAHLYRNQPAVSGAAATAQQAAQLREASMQRDGTRDGSSPPKGGIAGIAAGLAGGKGGVLLNRTAQWLRNRKTKGSQPQPGGAHEGSVVRCGVGLKAGKWRSCCLLPAPAHHQRSMFMVPAPAPFSVCSHARSTCPQHRASTTHTLCQHLRPPSHRPARHLPKGRLPGLAGHGHP